MFHFVAGNKVLYFFIQTRLGGPDFSYIRPSQQLVDIHVSYMKKKKAVSIWRIIALCLTQTLQLS